jgi:hypothetical protein
VWGGVNPLFYVFNMSNQGGSMQGPEKSRLSKESFLKLVTAVSFGACGIAVIASNFLAWMKVLGIPITGGETIFKTQFYGCECNFFYYSGEGVLWFTGFWAFFMGLILIIASMIIYEWEKTGCVLGIIAGSTGFTFALIDMLMINAGKFEHAAESNLGIAIAVDPGSGLVVFMISSFVAALFGGLFLLIHIDKEKSAYGLV